MLAITGLMLKNGATKFTRTECKRLLLPVVSRAHKVPQNVAMPFTLTNLLLSKTVMSVLPPVNNRSPYH